MAADHRRKRLNGATVTDCRPWEQHRTKKKKLEPPKSDSSAKSHISLEWDGNQNKVVAKREQVGLSLRQLRPFTSSVPQSCNILADVFTVPQEIFELEDLSKVLSYEVWQTLLTEKERSFLLQFLPRELDAEEAMMALLAGDNFHFGNPFLKWGSSLCLGNFHPDEILNQEQCIRAEKRAWYSEMRDYHNDMIKYLLKLKEKWEGSRDSENEALQKIRRSRRNGEEENFSFANDSWHHDFEDNAAASSESCSLVAEEKACSSDNQNSFVAKGGELRKRDTDIEVVLPRIKSILDGSNVSKIWTGRIYDKPSRKEKSKKVSDLSDDTSCREGNKVNELNIHHSGGAKYMSYLKISKKQHKIVKSMKKSGKSTRSKSLNHMLGDLGILHVQPYEDFVKEEQKKLQEHWVQLANNYLPAAYANWRERQFHRREITKSLEQDMKNKLESSNEDLEKENLEMVLQDQDDQGGAKYRSDVEDEEKANHETILLDENDQEARTIDGDAEGDEDSGSGIPQDQPALPVSCLTSGNKNLLKDDQGAGNLEPNLEDDENSGSLLYQSAQQISFHSSGLDLKPLETNSNNSHMASKASDASPDLSEYSNTADVSFGQRHTVPPTVDVWCDLKPLDMNSENNYVVSKANDASPVLSEYSGIANAVDASNSQGQPISSAGDVWSVASMPHPYYDAIASNEYSSASGLSIAHQGNEVQRPQFIDLESEAHQGHGGKDLLHRHFDNGSYPNHDRNGLLQSLFKGQGMLPNHHEQKLRGLDFQSPSNVLMEDVRFTGHLQGQLHPSMLGELGQRRYSEGFMQQNMSDSIYSERGGYLVPGQGHVQTINLQDWAVNPVHMAGQSQSQLNSDGFLNQNWFSDGNSIRSGWSGSTCSSAPSQSIGSNSDQSLFSVLSQCTRLRPHIPFDSLGSSEQLMLPRNYGMLGGDTLGISNALPQPFHSLDYLSGRDAASSMMPDGMGWMNLPQNSAIHDPMGRTYLRSWNQ